MAMARYSPISPTIPLPSNIKIEQIDEKIERLSKHLEAVSETEKPMLQSKLLTARLMKERLVAMTALAKAQVILAEMDVVTAENNLRVAVQELEHFDLETDMKLPEDVASTSSLKVDTTTTTQKPNKTIPEKQASPIISKPTPATANKENVSSNNKSAPSSHNKGHNSHSERKRKRSPTPNSKHQHKRSKKSHSSSKRTESTSKNAKSTSKRTVTPTPAATPSPISLKSSPTTKPKTGTFTTQGVQTSNTWFQKENKGLNNVSTRVLDDDEETIQILEAIDIPSSHKDVANTSKASNKVSSPPGNMYSVQFPVSSQIQLMFEDDPPIDSKKKTKKTKIKTEGPETGDELIL